MTVTNLGKTNNPFSFETKKFVYNIRVQCTSSLIAVTLTEEIKELIDIEQSIQII